LLLLLMMSLPPQLLALALLRGPCLLCIAQRIRSRLSLCS
jgi:hypothetical protein